jgi:NAD(P)H-dependent FMN reductase
MTGTPAPPLRVAIIIASTRQGSVGKAVGRWAFDLARERSDATYELIDVGDFNLPLLDEPEPASVLNPDLPLRHQYVREHTKAWSEAIASFDGYVFVIPEYNHGINGALKNAIDFLFHEWVDKVAGFIGYGAMSGARAMESLRLVMAALQVATVRPTVGLSLFTDFENGTEFRPAEVQEQFATTLLDHVVAWSGAMRSLRRSPVEPANGAVPELEAR